MFAKTLLSASFLIFSCLAAFWDIRTQSVPRAVFALALPVFLFLKFLPRFQFAFWESLLGLLAGLFVFLLAFFLSGKKLGLADVWYAGLSGLVLGLKNWYAATGVACAVAVIYILVFRRRRIPFIPFLVLGSVSIQLLKGWQQ
jgi:prepilin signal peptidase PulO-like enzyme (type II secretory pathway)